MNEAKRLTNYHKFLIANDKYSIKRRKSGCVGVVVPNFVKFIAKTFFVFEFCEISIEIEN